MFSSFFNRIQVKNDLNQRVIQSQKSFHGPQIDQIIFRQEEINQGIQLIEEARKSVINKGKRKKQKNLMIEMLIYVLYEFIFLYCSYCFGNVLNESKGVNEDKRYSASLSETMIFGVLVLGFFLILNNQIAQLKNYIQNSRKHGSIELDIVSADTKYSPIVEIARKYKIPMMNSIPFFIASNLFKIAANDDRAMLIRSFHIIKYAQFFYQLNQEKTHPELPLELLLEILKDALNESKGKQMDRSTQENLFINFFQRPRIRSDIRYEVKEVNESGIFRMLK